MTEYTVIYNKRSRRGAVAERVLRTMATGSVDDGVRLTWIPLSELERTARAPDRLVVVGGDGTVNAACEWLHRTGHSCPIGIVPAGTGNNLVRGLELPLDVRAAFRLALTGSKTRAIDAILYRSGEDARERIIIQSAALVFPAEIAAQYDRLRQRAWMRWIFRPLGPYIYRLLALLGIARQVWNEKRTRLVHTTTHLPGEDLEETALALFIGNERSLGGNFFPCPRARVDDGLMDLCLVRAGTGTSYLKLFRSISRGAHLEQTKDILYRQTSGPMTIRLDQPSWMVADGDLWISSDRFELELRAAYYRFVVG